MRPIKRFCRAICPQRRNCKRYLSTKTKNSIADMSKIQIFRGYPYDDKTLTCKYFLPQPADDD